MYTNGNVGNTFDQYKISYILVCIIIIIMQEVYITCPVFISTLIISVKRDLPCFAECCCGPGGVLSVVHSSATKMKLQTTTPSATPHPLLLDVHWPQKIWRTDDQQLQALDIAESKRACQHQVEWSRLVCSDCVWQALVCC